MAYAIRVLIADDTPEIRLLLRATLDGDGRFAITGEAADGAEAVDLARIQHPDAVILDLAMPVMDGLQAIPRIREHSPDTRIVVLSGFDSRQMEDEAMRRGAHAYFEKGRSLGEIIEALTGFYPDLARAAPGLPARDRAEPAPVVLEDLERADLEVHRLDVMLSTLIHELQTPVTVIRGFAATLQRAVDRMDQGSIIAGAAAIERSADNLQTLIRSLSDVRAIDSGRLELKTEPTDIPDLVRQTLKDLSVITDPHPVEMRAGQDIQARVDPTRIRQVLTNLLSNAA
ncbi:MAG: response regulator, partial [Actinomycetota bacterium]